MMANKDKWLIAINTENLKMILTQGLIAGSKGFSKYYKDSLSTNDGYIPVYKNNIPQKIVEESINEVDGLVPCFIEINIEKINKGEFQQDINNKEVINLLAPLPLSCVYRILFRSSSELNNFNDDARLLNNVVLGGIKLQSTKIDQKLFINKNNAELPKIDSLDFQGEVNDELIETVKSTIDLDYNKVYAYGGLLLNLFYFAKNGDLSNKLYDSVSDQTKENSGLEIDDALLYFRNGDFGSEPVSLKHKMYFGIVDIAIKNNDFKNKIIDYLEGDNWDESAKKRTLLYAGRLREIESSTSRPMSEYFNLAETPLEKLLIMLFIREDTDSLIDYKSVEFIEEEYLSFAVLFGIRDKIKKSPQFLREYSGLQELVSFKMAEYAHVLLNSHVTFEAPKAPSTVYSQCNKRINGNTVKELGLDNCVSTVMPASKFVHEKGKNIYHGFLKPKYEIDKMSYFTHMKKFKVTELIFNKLVK